MEDSRGSIKIETLSDNNYHAWKQKVVLLLTLKVLDDYIDSTILNERDLVYDKWVRSDRKAQPIIRLSLSDEHLENFVMQNLLNICGIKSRTFSNVIRC